MRVPAAVLQPRGPAISARLTGLGGERHSEAIDLRGASGATTAPSAHGQVPAFFETVKASLLFRADTSTTRTYPNPLPVYLRLENIHDSDIFWPAGLRPDDVPLFDVPATRLELPK